MEIHVSKTGNSQGNGDVGNPLISISSASEIAHPGDTIIVHEGTYRERIDPPRGGTSDRCRITYKVWDNDSVVIKGSEVINNWEWVEGDIWKAKVPNWFFGDDNPYESPISGHWFYDQGRNHHRGAVYLNGHWLTEAEKIDDLYSETCKRELWFSEVNERITTIWAKFANACPNEELVEINVRKTVFYPSRIGINYISVQGFTLCHAATPWAPPTTEQIGCIGTNWSKGWVIEDNVVMYSVCAGITLGKYKDPEDRLLDEVVEGTNGSDTFHGTIDRALENGWNFDSVGHHLIKNNQISHCEMAGICGSLGAIGSCVEGNTIHDIHTRKLFFGHEISGIKLHGAIDTEIISNRIYNCFRGLWLDWMNQGARVSRNLFYNNGPEHDFYLEVNHGPLIVDNNLFLSEKSINNCSQGTAFLHNLFLGTFEGRPVLNRVTPYHKPHSTEIIDLHNHELGDDRLINNIFGDESGTFLYNEATLDSVLEDNLYLLGATISHYEATPHKISECSKENFSIQDSTDKVFLVSELFEWLQIAERGKPVTSRRLGELSLVGAFFETVNGSELKIDFDYAGESRNFTCPIIGPFEAAIFEKKIPLWP